jgi:hypothetical protein
VRFVLLHSRLAIRYQQLTIRHWLSVNQKLLATHFETGFGNCVSLTLVHPIAATFCVAIS